MPLERDFQAKFIEKLRVMLPHAIILKNDSGYQQGIPDWVILCGPRWGLFEIKKKRPTKPSDWEPNQEWFIQQAASVAFGACVYPENEKEVLDAFRETFGSGG